MEGFEDSHSKLLYTIYRLHREGRISDEAKDILKAKVIKDDVGVLQVYRSFLEHENVELMEEELIEHLGKPLRKRPTGLAIEGRKSPEVAEEDSSPLGNFLKRRKKEHTEEHHDAPRSLMRPMQVMEDS